MRPHTFVGAGALYALLALVTGCGTGAMGQSQFAERHADGAHGLNAPLAQGASLEPEVNLQLPGSAAPTLELLSARGDVAQVQDGRIVGTGPGVTAILVTDKAGTVLDFYHLWVEKPTRASLHRVETGKDLGEVEGGIDLLVGESVEVEPKVYYETQELAGRISAEWNVEPAIATPMRIGAHGGRRLLATTPGEAQLQVKLGAIELTLPLRVLPVPGSAPHPQTRPFTPNPATTPSAAPSEEPAT
ncbi:MAG: hypothetical protein R3B89_06330 [Polyangiaceae bacterium]